MKSMYVQGPMRGYRSDEKGLYRWDVVNWLTIHRTIMPYDKVMCFPSWNGDEIQVWLDAGVKEENIYAIDREAYTLYHAPWRKKYPKVKIVVGELEDACAKLAKKGITFKYANLDLCGMRSPKTAAMLVEVRKTNIFESNARIAFTIQRGRDDVKLLKDYQSQLRAAKDSRPAFGLNCLLGNNGYQYMHDASYKTPKKNGDLRVPVMEYMVVTKK